MVNVILIKKIADRNYMLENVILKQIKVLKENNNVFIIYDLYD